MRMWDSREESSVVHPASMVMMGDEKTAPCDSSGRLREWPNVWVADASVFPTSGDAHPTLTVVAHTHRLVAALCAGGCST